MQYLKRLSLLKLMQNLPNIILKSCVLGPWPRPFLSLASRGSILEKSVFSLGFFRVLGLEGCVLDSTSARRTHRSIFFCAYGIYIYTFLTYKYKFRKKTRDKFFDTVIYTHLRNLQQQETVPSPLRV